MIALNYMTSAMTFDVSLLYSPVRYLNFTYWMDDPVYMCYTTNSITMGQNAAKLLLSTTGAIQ